MRSAASESAARPWMNGLSMPRHIPTAVAGLSTTIVNGLLTIILRLPHGLPLWHGAPMPTRSTRAGGCFLTIFILAGFVLGLAIANPIKVVLIGTATGAVLAILIWLIDRRR